MKRSTLMKARPESLKRAEAEREVSEKIDFKLGKSETFEEPAVEEADVWEVPAFIRRKKRKS